MIDVRAVTGDELAHALPALAELRIRVFREWPYLYEGSLEYEQSYLRKFSQAEDAVIIIAKDNEQIVGASTASPLLGHADAFAEPFAEKGFAPEKVFYFGESVLLPEYRGHGIGHAFFEGREKHAKTLGKYNTASFCAVIREDDDPRKPAGYHPLDAFWNKRGFHKEDGLYAEFSWKEPDHQEQVPHRMQFWVKKL